MTIVDAFGDIHMNPKRISPTGKVDSTIYNLVSQGEELDGNNVYVFFLGDAAPMQRCNPSMVGDNYSVLIQKMNSLADVDFSFVIGNHDAYPFGLNDVDFFVETDNPRANAFFGRVEKLVRNRPENEVSLVDYRRKLIIDEDSPEIGYLIQHYPVNIRDGSLVDLLREDGLETLVAITAHSHNDYLTLETKLSRNGTIYHVNLPPFVKVAREIITGRRKKKILFEAYPGVFLIEADKNGICVVEKILDKRGNYKYIPMASISSDEGQVRKHANPKRGALI